MRKATRDRLSKPQTERRGRDAPSALTRLRKKIVARMIFSGKGLVGRASCMEELKINRVWPTDPKRGMALAAGEIELCGILVRDPSPRWSPPAATDEWCAAWHGFDWISDVVAAGPAARDQVGQLVQSWLAEQAGFRQSVAWRSDVMGTRLFAWITHLNEITAGEKDPVLKRAVVASIAKQYRHLNRTALREVEGPHRLRALKGLVAAAIALGGSGARVMKALSLLEREMSAQILPDGGHRSRSPSLQLRALQDLVDIRSVLRAAKISAPGGISRRDRTSSADVAAVPTR